MHPRFHQFLVTLGIVFLCLIPLAIFFLGGASVSGGKLLNYPKGHLPSEEQCASDEIVLCEVFERCHLGGFPRAVFPDDNKSVETFWVLIYFFDRDLGDSKIGAVACFGARLVCG